MSDSQNNDTNDNSVIRIDIESMRLQIGSTVAKLRSRTTIDTIRPLPVFLGLNPGNDLMVSPKAFSSPAPTMDLSCLGKTKQRVKVNFGYFLSNYVLITAMTAVVVALMHPGMIVTVGIVLGLWWLHGCLIRRELVVFGVSVQNLLTVQQRFYTLFVITAFVIIAECLWPALVVVAIATFIVVTHAALRDTSQFMEVTDEESDRKPLFTNNTDANTDVEATPY